MSVKKKNLIKIFWIPISLIIFAGCQPSSSDGGSSSTSTSTTNTGSGLSVSSTVSVVDAKKSAANSSVSAMNLNARAISAAISASTFSSTSDYAKDDTVVYVHEETSRSINTVNNILCYFDQIQYDEMVNKGDYKAQVDNSQCDAEKGNSSESSGSGGGSDQSGGNKVSYTYWTANSSRADDNSPQIVKIWVEATSSEPQYIKAKMTITKGSSSTNSLGVFRLDFVGYKVDADLNPTSETTMKGFMYTSEGSSEVTLKFYNKGAKQDNGQLFTYEEGINISRNTDGSAGSGSALGQKWSQTGPTPIVYDFSYTNDYFYRGDDSNNVACLDRNNFNETAWRYGVYDSNGARVKLNSGFPISITTAGKTYHGWIGYWGLWMPSEAAVTNGTTVTKEAFGSAKTDESYTVFQVGGKLEKNTKKTVTMAQIKNIPLSWWNEGADNQVIWDGSNLVKVAYRNQASSWQWQPLASPVPITFSAGTFGFFFYSDALGGNGQIKFDNWGDITKSDGSGIAVQPTVSAASTVIFHVRETVFPGDSAPASLMCFNNCPDPSKLDSINYYFTSDWNNPAEVIYTFADSVLKYYDPTGDATTDVVMATSGQNNKNGVWSGALFENTTANLTALQCPWNASQICAWQAWEKLPVYYTWSTGPNDWQKLTTLTSGGSYLKFDSPMQFKYTHLGAGDYKDTTFYLEYQGFGNLQGIPEMCINTSTGVEKNCWEVTEDEMKSGNFRWMRKFVIPNGSLAVGTDTTAAEYVIKALEVEQAMKTVDNSVCTDAGLSLISKTLPAISEWVDPNIGAAPTLSGAPSVIGGVVQ